MTLRPPSKLTFSLALFFTIFAPLWFPKLHLFYFAPYLILTFYRTTRYKALWSAFGCGLLIDLFSSNPFFGLTAVNYCVVTFIIHGQVRNFFEDKFSTLPLMTALFSVFSTLLSMILLFFLGNSVELSWEWCATDLLLMPLADALYGFLFFSLLFQLLHKIRWLIKSLRIGFKA